MVGAAKARGTKALEKRMVDLRKLVVVFGCLDFLLDRGEEGLLPQAGYYLNQT